MSFYFPSGKRIKDKRVVFFNAGSFVPAYFLAGGCGYFFRQKQKLKGFAVVNTYFTGLIFPDG